MFFDVSDIAWLVLSVVGLVQAFFVTIILRQDGKRAFVANRWLLVFVWAVGCSFLESLLDVLLPASAPRFVTDVLVAAPFATLPSIYLYFRVLSGRPVRGPVLHYLLTIMMVIVISVTSIMLYDLAEHQKTARKTEILLSWQETPLLWSIDIAILVVLYIQLIAYMVAIWRVSVSYRTKIGIQLGDRQPHIEHWIRELLISITVIFMLFSVDLCLGFSGYSSEWVSIFVYIALILVFFRISHLVSTNQAIFIAPECRQSTGDTDFEAVQTKAQRAPSRQLVSAEDASILIAELDRVVHEKDLLLDPLITMPKLAKAIGTQPNTLSFVLNQYVGKSFFDYVNAFRIERASHDLIAEPDRNVLDIAMNVGFNSKSTFNLAFKKVFDQTPTAYRNENLNKTNG